MSLNQVLIGGKVGDGLDLEVKSINTDADSGSFIRGNFTVGKISDLMGDVTCEENLTVVGLSNLYGGIKLNNQQVKFDGVQTLALAGIVCAQMNNFVLTLSPFKYQRYGNILHITGSIVGDIISIANSKQIEITLNIPTGYTFAPPYLFSRFLSVSGGGVNTAGVGTSQGVYIATLATPLNATTYKIWFNTGTGQSVTGAFAGQLLLNFSIFIDGVNDL